MKPEIVEQSPTASRTRSICLSTYVLADLLSWILTQKGISPVFHYLDDFLTLGPPGSFTCAHNLATIKEVCSTLGIPLALEKVEGPSHSLTFLGITLDTQEMMARLPADKTTKNSQFASNLGKEKESHEEGDTIPSALLQHATKAVKPGRTFVAIMYSEAVCLHCLSFFTRLSKDFHSYLRWHLFVHAWNGVSFLECSPTPWPPDVVYITI